jgi:hypothetical protein
VFATLCETWLGTTVNWTTFRFFFRSDRTGEGPVGSTSFCLRGKKDPNNIPVPLSTSHTGWHVGWFYLHDDRGHPLGKFINHHAGETHIWKYAPEARD